MSATHIRPLFGSVRKKAAKLHVRLRRGQIIRDFNALYYYSRQKTWQSLEWRGVPCLKCPTDLWSYQEIITATRPEVIVECGICFGGTTRFLADLCRLNGEGEVIGVDVDLGPVHAVVRADERVTLFQGSSVAPEVVAAIRERCAGRRTMVILDSDHHYPHVRAELEAYSALVSPGCYLVVEDTSIAGHPVRPEWPDGGPYQAARDFRREHPQFENDPRATRLMLTFNPDGYLRRAA